MTQATLSSKFQGVLVLILLVLAFELGGIWFELRRARQEQVKNKYYSLPEEVRSRIPIERRELLRKKLEGTAYVEIENQPLSVEIENQPIEVTSWP
ncbi:MAG TPA: hypothetical protein VJ085_00810 [Candidatus Acidoferrales bacterium]|nr:hypothetical protein [Candidatus Acidoferrales bacterium]